MARLEKAVDAAVSLIGTLRGEVKTLRDSSTGALSQEQQDAFADRLEAALAPVEEAVNSEDSGGATAPGTVGFNNDAATTQTSGADTTASGAEDPTFVGNLDSPASNELGSGDESSPTPESPAPDQESAGQGDVVNNPPVDESTAANTPTPEEEVRL